MKIGRVLTACAVLLTVAGCQGRNLRASVVERPTVKINVDTWLGYAPLRLALEKKMYQGVDVEIVVTPDVAQRKLLLVSGDNQAIAETFDTLVLDRSQGIRTVAVIELDVSNGADGIVVVDRIHVLRDLIGERVAVQYNYVSQLLLNYFLEREGIPFDAVRTQDTEGGAAGAAFVAGKVDAAVTFEPWLSKAKERRGGKILLSSKDAPGVVVDVLSFREDYLETHRREVSAVVRGWFDAVQYWRDHTQEANAIMAKYYDLTPQEFVEQIAGLRWPSLEENIQYFGTAPEVGPVYDIASTFVRIFLKTGQIESEPDLSHAVDSSTLQSLYEERQS